MTKRRKRNLGSASDKLAELDFCPIEAQVNAYKKLMEEIAYQESLAAGTNTVKRLNKDGSEKAYRIDFHMNLVARAAELAEKLMRYGYTFAEEEDDDKMQTPVLNINLADGSTVTYGNAPQDPE